MKTGQVKRVIADRGFGFIQCGTKEYFFHTSQCVTAFDTLQMGDNVKFEVENSPKGPRAIDVEKI